MSKPIDLKEFYKNSTIFNLYYKLIYNLLNFFQYCKIFKAIDI